MKSNKVSEWLKSQLNSLKQLFLSESYKVKIYTKLDKTTYMWQSEWITLELATTLFNDYETAGYKVEIVDKLNRQIITSGDE